MKKSTIKSLKAFTECASILAVVGLSLIYFGSNTSNSLLLRLGVASFFLLMLINIAYILIVRPSVKKGKLRKGSLYTSFFIALASLGFVVGYFVFF